MIGQKLRAVRHSQQLSLNQVAEKARVSVATLSRIETNKQALDLGLFLVLAKILKTAPQDLLSVGIEEEEGTGPLVNRITSLDTRERTTLWRQLATVRRDSSRSTRRAQINLSHQVEELLAQVDFLREEIEAVRLRMKRR